MSKLFDTLNQEFDILPLQSDLQNIENIVLEEAGFSWIPVSERLPHVSNYYLISDDLGDVWVACIYTSGKWYDPSGTYEIKVIAWMPLPKPYKKFI